jgi:hypothetical protein
MKRRRIYVLVFGCVVLVVASGIRVATGQGYSDPMIRPVRAKVAAATSQRTLEVRLENRRTGRPQYYHWSLSMPPHGSVEIECHEWTHVRLFGLQLFGVPRNSFHRMIQLDLADEGVAEPYHYIIRWRTPNA